MHATGQLPWQRLWNERKDQPKYAKMSENEFVATVKRKTPMEILCAGLPKEFSDFLLATRNLEFDEKPNYEGYRKMFRNLFDECVGSPLPPPPRALALAHQSFSSHTAAQAQVVYLRLRPNLTAHRLGEARLFPRTASHPLTCTESPFFSRANVYLQTHHSFTLLPGRGALG
jgi:hypothetical protein